MAVRGSVAKKAGGAVAWKAEIAIGTLDELVTPADVAKVMQGAQETFSGCAGEMLRGIGDPDTIARHGLPLKDAVSEVAEHARKSAAARPGWSVGLQARGDDGGGFSAGVTLAWVF